MDPVSCMLYRPVLSYISQFHLLENIFMPIRVYLCCHVWHLSAVIQEAGLILLAEDFREDLRGCFCWSKN